MTAPEVISLGSVNLDFQVRADRWPEPGETMAARDFHMLGGGKAANVAVVARRLGVPTRLVAHLGDDVLRETALAALRACGVDLCLTRTVARRATGLAFITVRADGSKSIVLAANANDEWTPQDADAAASAVSAADPGSVLVADLEVPVSVVQRTLQAAQARGCTVIVDPSPADRLTEDLFPLIDFLTPNPAEARRLTGVTVSSVQDAFQAGKTLLERGVRTALVKLGDGGCVVVSAGVRGHIPAPPVTVVDTTGAGDAFAGALAVALIEGRLVADAATFAVAAATFSVKKYGAQPSYPSRPELDAFMQQHRLDATA
ncbi:MAG: ribokinase [Chloroflexi bacterium]|nr:ribokinase [Chloroflexota bacterium]